MRAVDEGFLLSEVPRGSGFLELPRIVATLRKAKPAIVLNLEMATRDPLRVPCLTDGFFATFPDRKASPFIAHWPAGIPASQGGNIVTGPAHIMDVFPTCPAAASAKHPATFAGHAVQPLEGTSLLPALRGEAATLPMERPIFWERMGNEAVRQGHWKLVRGYGPSSENGSIATTGPRTGKWELYNTSTDPGETHDLAAQQSEKVALLVSQHEAWAKRVGVVPREKIVEAMRTSAK